jgi:hypothetical protein
MGFRLAMLILTGLSAFASPCWAENSIPLVKAATDGDVTAAKRLLDQGADPNSHDAYAALNWASHNGHLPVVKVLIDRGADINAHDNPNKWTPLMIAAGMGHDDVAMFLVDHGAEVNAFDATGEQALLYATQNHRLKLARFLVAHGADALPALGTDPNEPNSCNFDKGQHVVLTGKIGKTDAGDPLRSGELPLSRSPACPADLFSLHSDSGYPSSCTDGHGIRFTGTVYATSSDFPGWMYFVKVESSACD